MKNSIVDEFFSRTRALGISVNDGDRFLIAQVFSQKLYVYRIFSGCADLDTTFNISTGKNPMSCIENSLGTPIGMHKICEKVGNFMPVGSVFVARKSVGMLADEYDQNREKSFVATRILRLTGLEDGINSGIDTTTGLSCDTYKRCVYIHGLSFDDYISAPSTNGCIALKGLDMITLFNMITINTLLFIAR